MDAVLTICQKVLPRRVRIQILQASVLARVVCEIVCREIGVVVDVGLPASRAQERVGIGGPPFS